jgi:hypothetical protein
MKGRGHGRGSSNRARAGFGALLIAGIGLMCVPAGSSAGYVNYPDFHSTGGLTFNGDAEVSDTNALRLTAGFGQVGGVFTEPEVIDAGEPIKSSFTFSLHDGGGDPGDGFTYVIQADNRDDFALGEGGGGMGYGGVGAISDSVAVEFNTYGDGPGPQNVDHVSILRDGNVADHMGAVAADIYGSARYAWVDYSAKKRNLKVFLASTSTKPAAPITSAKVNLKKTLGASEARAGFTGGTGGAFMVQDILSWKVAN